MQIVIGRVSLALVAAIVALIGVAAIGRIVAFEEREVTIPVPGGELSGVLATPKAGEAQGLVVMVHGDGPVDATQGGLYDTWFDGSARSGFATLSWSKPGIGGSDGDWLAQSLGDRADEVGYALDWAREQPEIPTSSIVLWGASQAGWVLPSVVAEREDVDGVVAVGTAINWLRQGSFSLRAELDHEEASAATRASAEEDSARTNALLEQGADYEQYRAATTADDPMSRDRWGFVQRNFRADASAELRRAAPRAIPWLLLAGRHDRNVDVAETAEVYGGILGEELTVTWVDAVHSMARPSVDSSEVLGTATWALWPRALLASGVIEAHRGLLENAARTP